jgi:hypothetical protein
MTNRVGRDGRSYHTADFRRIVGADAANFRLRFLTLPDGEVDRELLSVALSLPDGTVVEVRGAADGIRLVLAPTKWGEKDMAGLGRITEHRIRRQGIVTSLRHILGTRTTELILGFEGQSSWSIMNDNDMLLFREIMPE